MRAGRAAAGRPGELSPGTVSFRLRCAILLPDVELLLCAWTHRVLRNHWGPQLAHSGPLSQNTLIVVALQGYHRCATALSSPNVAGDLLLHFDKSLRAPAGKRLSSDSSSPQPCCNMYSSWSDCVVQGGHTNTGQNLIFCHIYAQTH